MKAKIRAEDGIGLQEQPQSGQEWVLILGITRVRCCSDSPAAGRSECDPMGVLNKMEPRSSAASKAKPLVRASLCLVVLAVLLPLHATAEEKPNSFCDAIEKYILRVDDIAYGIDDPGKRTIAYDIALKKLMAAAHAYFGPSCPCDRILRDARFQEYAVESYRKPPPGWEPGPTPENVVLFTQISRHTLRAQMELTKWCWEKQSGTDRGKIPSGRRSHADARSRR